MKLYDGTSDIDWFYDGPKTRAEMDGDSRYPQDGRAVLHDDGAGKVYSWQLLDVLCDAFGVTETEDALADFDAVETAMEEVPPDRAEQALEMAESARQAADEAKAIAEQAGTDPQLQALATMQVATMDLTSYNATQVMSFRDYWPEWKPDTQYKQNDPLRYKGVYYRVSQDTTSSSVYPPDVAGESQYYPIEVAPDGIIVYRPCHGEYDMVRAGEKRHYPDAEGPVYLAKVDTAYDPDTVPGNWELVDGEPTEQDEGETTTEPEEPSDEPTEPTIPEFIQPTGAHDAYGIGDRVTYNGKVYESTMAGNAYSPDAYPQGWKLVE